MATANEPLGAKYPTLETIHVDPTSGAPRPYLVDDALRDFLPSRARDQLRKNILESWEIRDPLVAGQFPDGTRKLLEGHGRDDIAWNEGIPYSVKVIAVGSLAEAHTWQLDNQEGRRNMTAQELSLARATIAQAESREHGDSARFSHVATVATCSARARDKVAERLGVSPRTIQNDIAFKRHVDSLAEDAPELHRQINRGEVEVSRSDAAKLAQVPSDARRQVQAQVVAGQPLKKVVAGIKQSQVPSSDPRLDRLFEDASKLIIDVIRAISRIPRGAEPQLCKAAHSAHGVFTDAFEAWKSAALKQK